MYGFVIKYRTIICLSLKQQLRFFKRSADSILRQVISFLFIFSNLNLTAQNEANSWYFGYHMGLDFSSVPPVVVTDGQTNTLEGVASISNASGHLLFYTNGVTIWNNQHQVMPNGNGLFGATSSTQSAIIVPMIGDPSRYYVFTVDEFGGPNGLNYSIVNINMDNGRGDVEIKNRLLQTPVCEKVTAVKHCNGRDIWVITHGWNSDNFYAFLVTAAGVATTPIVSNSGRVVTGNIDATIGYLKASPDGKKLAAAHHLQGLDLLDFNNVTGIISNPVSLFLPAENYSNPYGVEFSPSGKFLYATVSDYYLAVPQHHNWLLQYDISLSNPPSIIASKKIIYSDNAPVQTFGALQMGPNGKMYMVAETVQGISEIDRPDSSGASCQFNFNEIPVGNNQICHYGLPSFIQSYWLPSFTFTETCSSEVMNFYYTRPPNITSVKWDFGDPLSGINNFSVLDSPSHTFTSPGLFTVKLVRYTTCGSDTVEKQTLISPLNVNLGNDTILCSTNNYVIDPGIQSSYSFLWQDGSTNPTLTANQTGIYWVEVTNNQNGCSKRDTIQLAFNPHPIFSLGNDTAVCGQFILSANFSPATYLWNTGNTSINQNVISSGLYWVDVTVAGCTKRDSINVIANPTPIVNLGSDTTLCEDESILLDARNSGSYYEWQNNTTNQTYLVSKQGLYWVKVTRNGCSVTDTINVNYKLKPVFSLGRDTSICEGMSLLLQPVVLNPENIRYLWGNGSTSFSISITQPGAYSLQLSNLCGTKSDQIIISKGLCKLYVPSAFTPNGDGLNDIFRARGKDVKEFKIQVYNRWGQLVYETSEINKGWDGKINGIKQPNGVYIWLIRFKIFSDPKEQMLKGQVTIIR
jgi:gliding motility-associated-like protein